MGSYQPPQSSHMTMTAVFFQYWLSPTAFTTDVTHEGPVSLPLAGWSESKSCGITHETAGNVPFLMSPKIFLLGDVTFFQSGP